MQKFVIKNNLLIILDELSIKPSGAYASDIESSINKNHEDYKIALGTIIITLGRLQKMNLVTAEEDGYKTNGIIRKRYRITNAGRQALVAHIKSFKSFNLNDEQLVLG